MHFGLSRWERAAARLRMPLSAVGGVGVIATGLLAPGRPWPLVALATFLVGMALYFRVGTPHGGPVDLGAPVEGRWVAIHSPTSKVPSHGLHAWAQTHAIDLVYDPGDGSRPGFSARPVSRPPEDFPGFARPVISPVDGVVVRARGCLRDHRSRTSPWGLAYLLIESVREVFGPPGILGNHVVIRDRDGAHVLFAHLRRRSLTVGKGDEVTRGDMVGECGNSGNSTEPHLHLQAMDRASVWLAAGLSLRIEGEPPPPNGGILGGDRSGG